MVESEKPPSTQIPPWILYFVFMFHVCPSGPFRTIYYSNGFGPSEKVYFAKPNVGSSTRRAIGAPAAVIVAAAIALHLGGPGNRRSI